MESTSFLRKSNSDTSRRQPAVWDCGSSLYDSFELKSFEKHLHSAMVPRTFSMPQTFDRRPPPPHDTKKHRVNITRTLQRLFRSVFRTKRGRDCHSKDMTLEEEEGLFMEKISKEPVYYIFYDKSAALSSIPEGNEFDGPLESRKFVRRTVSARVSGVGIY